MLSPRSTRLKMSPVDVQSVWLVWPVVVPLPYVRLHRIRLIPSIDRIIATHLHYTHNQVAPGRNKGEETVHCGRRCYLGLANAKPAVSRVSSAQAS